MRNSNKRRISLKTILIYCEWYCEYALCLYLKDLFHKRWGGFTVTIINWYWWSPVKTVERAMKDDWFDEKYVWIDTDRPELEEARSMAGQNCILIVENILCIESELLKVVDIKIKWASDHKSIFKKNYPELDLTDKRSYETLLSKGTIKWWRKKSDPINKIIEILEKGNI